MYAVMLAVIAVVLFTGIGAGTFNFRSGDTTQCPHRNLWGVSRILARVSHEVSGTQGISWTDD